MNPGGWLRPMLQKIVDAFLRHGIEWRNPCGIEVVRACPFDHTQRFILRRGHGRHLAGPAPHGIAHEQIHVLPKDLLFLRRSRRLEFRAVQVASILEDERNCSLVSV